MSECFENDKWRKASEALFAGRTADKCLVIGSNPSLERLDLKDYVDAYDGDVIRINKLARPSHTANYGSRTDVLFACSWADKTVPQNFQPKIVIDDDLILDLSGDVKGKSRPNLTTGLICVLLALHKYNQVELIGFGMPNVEESGHYKTIWPSDAELDMQVSSYKHDINFEHKMLWDLVNGKFLGKLVVHEWRQAGYGRRCAFAMYARGDRYVSFLRNVAAKLNVYVPGADLVIMDAAKAEACLPDLPERSGRHNWDKSIFMRLAIPLMDEFREYDRVIWLDSDVDIVSSKFANILDVETSVDGLAAARDPGSAMCIRELRKSFPDVHRDVYFNSGVVVMDLCKIDREMWRYRIWSGIKRHIARNMLFPDQDILNAYFDIRPIDEKYNTFSTLDSARRSPYLIHYAAGKGKNRLDAIVRRNSAPKVDPDNPVDAVFVIGTGSVHNNEELRYALRNLERHCPFVRNVYICGQCPSWVDKSEVIHLPWPDRFHHAKDANIIDKLRHACVQPGIAKRVLFCSDDQFQTRECSWEDFAPRFLRKFVPGDTWYDDKRRVWHSRLRKTLEREVERRKSVGMDASDVYYYQPHIWMPIDRDKFLEYAAWCGYETRDDTIIASGYFNFADAHGAKDFDHVFLGSTSSGRPGVTHVAYNDGCYRNAMNILVAMLPERCRFEVGPSASHSPSRPPAHSSAQHGGIRHDPIDRRGVEERRADIRKALRRRLGNGII